MGQLGGKGDHLVMLFRRGNGKPAKARRSQQLLDPTQQVDVIVVRRDQHHGGIVEHGGCGVLEAGIVGARHGVPTQIGEAVCLRQREAGVADQPLCAAAVDDHRLRADMSAVLPQIVYSSGGIDGDQDQVAGGKTFLR